MPVPTAHHYHPLVRSLAKGLKQRCGVTPGASIVVACSGGADSVALLRALAMLAGRRAWRLDLIVGHVQHHLRDEAEDDARFVAELAETLGLPFARRDIEPADLPGNLEANSSRLRYLALATIAAEYRAGFIATAHHADDQLETLLMRILRGTSVAGLRGIAWHKPVADENDEGDSPLVVIRPMLGIQKQVVADLLDQLGQDYRNDTTNDDTTRTRAKLRHDIIPLLEALHPDAAQRANELTEHFRDLHELVQAAANEAQETGSQRKGSLLQLPRQEARVMNRVVLAELLRRSLIEAGSHRGQLSRHALLPAIHAAQDTVGGTRDFTFANGVQLTITRDSITVNQSEKTD